MYEYMYPTSIQIQKNSSYVTLKYVHKQLNMYQVKKYFKVKKFLAYCLIILYCL